MKFYNWKSPQTRDFIVYKSVAVNDLGRTGYIIEAETKTAIKYINKIMGSIQQDGLRSKWITIDQAEHNILFIDNKKVLFKFMANLTKTDFVVDDHIGYETYLLIGAR